MASHKAMTAVMLQMLLLLCLATSGGGNGDQSQSCMLQVTRQRSSLIQVTTLRREAEVVAPEDLPPFSLHRAALLLDLPIPLDLSERIRSTFIKLPGASSFPDLVMPGLVLMGLASAFIIVICVCPPAVWTTGKDDGEGDGCLQEMWTTGKAALPITMVGIFQYLPVMLSLPFLGHMGSAQDMAAATLGRSISNACYHVGWGFMQALYTFSPQAEGAGRSDLQSVYCQRSVLLGTVVCVLLAVFMMHSEQVLQALGRDATSAAAAAAFAMRCIPRIFVETYFTALQIIAQSVGFSRQLAWVTLLGVPAAFCFLWLFTQVFRLGYLGVAWSSSAWTGFNLLTVAIYLGGFAGLAHLFRPHPKTGVLEWGGVCEYLRLGLPAMVHACMDWWVVDIGVSLLVVSLPNTDVNLATTGTVACIEEFFELAWAGMAGAAAIAVGKHIGAGDAKAAKTLVAAVIVFSVCLGLATSTMFWCGRVYIATLFNSGSPEVLAETTSTFRPLAILIGFDCVNVTASGILRGMGLQRYSVAIFFVTFYVVALPCAGLVTCVYGATPMGLELIWSSIVLGTILCSLASIVTISRVDWKMVLSEAEERRAVPL